MKKTHTHEIENNVKPRRRRVFLAISTRFVNDLRWKMRHNFGISNWIVMKFEEH